MTADPLALGALIAFCGWDPTAVVTDTTVKLDGNGSRILTLPSLHVTDVSAVSVTDAYGTVRDLTIGTAPADVGWNEAGELALHGWCQIACWPVGLQNVSVTYSGGYADVPPEITAALASIARRMPNAGLKSKTMSKAKFEYDTSNGGDLLMVEKLVLGRYRILKAA